MLFPYGLSAPRRPFCALDRWIGPGWRLLEHHRIDVGAPPAAALDALTRIRLGELPAVTALFALRRLRFSKDMTFREFFSTAPFVLLEEEPGREIVGGVLIPPSGGDGSREPPASAVEFRKVLPSSLFAALATFRAEPVGGGSRLWTETWVRTRGTGPGFLFGAYWLAIGPWSAWIRRMFLRAARDRAERAAPGAA